MKNISEEKHPAKLFKLWILNPDSQIACVSKGKHDTILNCLHTSSDKVLTPYSSFHVLC